MLDLINEIKKKFKVELKEVKVANEKVFLHRHLGHNHTFVIQGEHRLYHPDGTLKEIRPVGSMTSSPPSDDPHREGAGDQDAVVAFSMRRKKGVMYEILDDDMNIVDTISFQDLVDLDSAPKVPAR